MVYRLAIPLAALLVLPGQDSQSRDLGRLDGSRAFFYPPYAAEPAQALARLGDEDLTAETYLRYLTARVGTRYLEDLAFDIVLAAECRARGLAKSAPVLARGTATQRLHESDRDASDDPDGSTRRKFANESLRQQRIDALVRADRKVEAGALRELFDRRYGPGGERVEVRQILVSFAGTRRRLARAGEEATAAAVEDAARERAEALHRQLTGGATLGELLGQSDDRKTRAALADPERAARAGLVSRDDRRRYGAAFGAAVRGLQVGQVSTPVASQTGWHLIELVAREVTRFEDVSAALSAELRRGPASQSEIRDLRRALLEKHRFQVKR